MTVKGLEPEIQRLIAKHKSEVKKMKQIHEAEMLEADERAAQRYVKMTEELRDQLAQEKEAAVARERELGKERWGNVVFTSLWLCFATVAFGCLTVLMPSAIATANDTAYTAQAVVVAAAMVIIAACRSSLSTYITSFPFVSCMRTWITYSCLLPLGMNATSSRFEYSKSCF